MSIKIGKIYESDVSNSTVSRHFFHSSVTYYNISSKLNHVGENDFDLWNFMYVGLPLMHMAIELMLKAFVAFYDDKYDPKSDNHRTSLLVKSNVGQIPAFKLITESKENMNLIKELQKGWVDLRYGGSGVSYSGEATKRFEDIFLTLAREYKKISGIKNYNL